MKDYSTGLFTENEEKIDGCSFLDGKKFILASQSPRRKALLEMTGIPFEIKIANIDEKSIEDNIIKKYDGQNMYNGAKELTLKLAFEKAKKISNENKGFYVIGSDTVVSTEEKILGKPIDEDDAYNTLRGYFGKKHRVYTGVSILLDGEEVESFYTMTEVEFYEYDESMDSLIRRYIKTKSPMDKAGSYGIQDMGGLFVKEIKGDFFTVMGFPIAELYRRLVSL